MSDNSPIKPISTSTPINKLRSHVSFDKNTSDEIDYGIENRSRSLRRVQIDSSSDDSMLYKGQTNQSLHERLMRKERQKVFLITSQFNPYLVKNSDYAKDTASD
jgi:hypothetical protein